MKWIPTPTFIFSFKVSSNKFPFNYEKFILVDTYG